MQAPVPHPPFQIVWLTPHTAYRGVHQPATLPVPARNPCREHTERSWTRSSLARPQAGAPATN